MRAPEDRLFERYRRRHDPWLLAKVFDRTAPALLRIARHAAPRRDLADDLLQQTFLAAIEGADRWAPERGLFPWLVGILVRQARLLHRAEEREPTPERLGSAQQPPQPADAAEARELEQAIVTAAAELGDTYRPVLHLHLFHGLNAKEIAAALDRPAGSVRTQLVRGLDRLRSALPVGLAVGAVTLAPVLADVRGRLLQHVAAKTTHLATSGLSTSVLLLGGSTMKKAWMAAAALLLVALVTVPLLTFRDSGIDDSPARPGTAQRADASLETRGTTSPVASTAAVDGSQLDAMAAAERQALTRPGATLRVRVVAEDSEESHPLPGIWVHLQDDRSRRPGEAGFGARTDADGWVRFDDVPATPWQVTAMTGAEDVREWVTPEPGTVRDVLLRSRTAHFVVVQVTDTRGAPVANAEVWTGLQIGGRRPPLRTSTRRGGVTDAAGRTRVAVGRGEVVNARKTGHSASPSSPVAAETADVSLVLGDGPGTLRGQVFFEDGAPASDATVRVFPAASTETRRLTAHRDDTGREVSPPLAVLRAVDAEGRFEIDGLAPGTYRVWTDASTPLYEGELVTLATGQHREVRLVLPRRAWVTGEVVRPDGSTAAGLLIGVRRPADEHLVLSDVVDSDGRFSFAVPAGPVRIRIWRDADAPLLEAEAIARTDPESLELLVRDPLSVAGRLSLEDGTSVAGWIVGVLARGVPANHDTVSEALEHGRFARSAADGSFMIHGAVDGPLTVFAAPVRRAVTGPAPLTLNGVAVGTQGLALTVPSGLLEASSVTVRVVGENGAPMPESEALLRAGDETFRLQQRDGALMHDRLVQGDYVLEVRAPGHASQTWSFTLDSPSLDLGTRTLVPSVPVHVTLRLDERRWQGALPQPVLRDALTGALVAPQPVRHETPEGTLLLDGLPPGHYELRPSPNDDLLGAPVAFALVRDEPLHLDWPVRIGRALTLHFAADPEASAAERLHVTIRNDSGDVVSAREVPPDRDGTRFALRHEFAPGRYTIEALRGSAPRWRLALDTARWPNGGTVEVPRR